MEQEKETKVDNAHEDDVIPLKPPYPAGQRLS